MRLPKLRISTVVFLLLLAVVILLANIPGQVVSGPTMPPPWGTCGAEFGIDVRCHHGWPFTFLVRERVSTAFGAHPLWGQSLWNPAEGVVERSWWRLAGDVFVGLTVLFVAGAAFERWRRHRGRFQLRLIDMFAIVTLVACGLAYWATLAAERTRQANVVARMKDSGALTGGVEWSSGGLSWLRERLGDQPFTASDRVVSVWVAGEGLTQLSELPNLKLVWVFAPSTHAQIDALRELPNLEALVMMWAGISHEETQENSDERIRVYDADPYIRLPRLPHLRGLNLRGASFRGEGLEHLRDIEVLDLAETNLDDAAMAKFESMRKLRILSLVDTDITDIGLEHLKGLRQLQEFYLGTITRVTAEGIDRLQKALPNCKIVRVPNPHCGGKG